MTAAESIDLDLRTANRLLAGAGFRAADVVRLTAGGMSAVFEARSAGGDGVVVKVYTDEWRWKMEKEVFVYDVLRQHGVAVPVPVILVADDSKTLLAQSFIVMTKLQGRLIFSLLDRLDEDELVSINRQVGAVLRRLHEVAFDAFGYVGTHGVVEPHATNLDYMSFQFDKKLRQFAELGGDPGLGRTIEQHVAERLELLGGCPRPAFCHNDCHDGNVLVLPSPTEWRVSGLLDFENVVAGDPLLDVAKRHYYARRPSEATLAALADGHGSLRDDWRDAFQLYVLYHALELWDWFALLGNTEPLASIADDMRRRC